MLKDIHQFLKILLSESNKHQQDLNQMSEDISSLKFGFSLLQHANVKLSADSENQNIKLKELDKILKAHKMDTKTRLTEIDTCLDTHKTDTEDRLTDLRTIQHPCGGPGWIKVVDFDMANPNMDCPPGWTESIFSKRTCGRSNNSPDTCSPAIDEQTFSRVCGRVKAYAYGGVDDLKIF